jgi:ribosomal protein S27AE
VSEVIDMNARRLAKAVAGTDQGKVKTEQVALLGCTNCGSTKFSLAHDRRIICGKCCFAIEALRWYDLYHPDPSA